MMRVQPIRYHAARSVAEAASVLRDEGAKAMLLAGGTDLVPNMKRRQQTPEVVVSLRRIGELKEYKDDSSGGLSIGAGVTLSEVIADRRIRANHEALYRAAGQVATPPLRNMGTIGGNICLDTRCNYYDQNHEWRKAIDFCMKAPGPNGHAVVQSNDSVCWVAPGSPRCWAVSSTDTAPALIALGASVSLVSRVGERRIPLADLYANDGMAYLTKQADEVLTQIHLPARTSAWRSTYWKLRRRQSFDFPVLAVAVAVRFGKDQHVEEASVVFGAVASRPVAAPGVENLIGKKLTDDAIESFADRAAQVAKPLDNTDFALSWRKKVAHQYVAGALKQLRGDDPAGFPVLARRAATMLPLV
jgi:4-hydroxybenzoyl-CoA reductase subunit beta